MVDGVDGVDVVEAAVLRLAEGQLGLLRRDQARAAGMSTRQIGYRVSTSRWVELLPGVYRVGGAPRSWRQRVRAAALWAGRDYALSHRTAASLWSFSRYGEGPVELLVTRNARAPDGCVVRRVPSLSFHDVRTLDGVRVTSRVRTLLDLAQTETEADLRAALDEALNRRWLTLDQLEAELEKRSHGRGLGVLRELVHRYRGGDGPSESELEARVLELLESAGLADVERQRRVVVAGRLRRLDFRLPGTPVVIEADGYAWHASLESFEKDRARRNALTAHGYRVLHWTWSAVHERPEALVRELH